MNNDNARPPDAYWLTDDEIGKLSGPASARGVLQRALLRQIRAHEADGMLPTNARFLFYELEGLGFVTKDQPPRYDGKKGRRPDGNLQDALTHLREARLVSWSDIEDETRALSSWRQADTVADYVLGSVRRARIDAWAGKPAPLILTESRSLAGVLQPVAGRYLCPIASTNGQAKGFLINEVAPALRPGQRVLYLGDWDFCGGQIEDHTRLGAGGVRQPVLRRGVGAGRTDRRSGRRPRPAGDLQARQADEEVRRRRRNRGTRSAGHPRPAHRTAGRADPRTHRGRAGRGGPPARHRRRTAPQHRPRVTDVLARLDRAPTGVGRFEVRFLGGPRTTPNPVWITTTQEMEHHTMSGPLFPPDFPDDREMYNDFMYETNAVVATWLLGVMSNLKPVVKGGGDELIFQRAVEMLKRISDVDGIDPAMLDIRGEGRMRPTVENDQITEAYVRAFETGQCVTTTSPDLSAFAAGYLMGLRPNGIVGLQRGRFSQSDRENVMHGMAVEVLLDEAGFTPPGGNGGEWEREGCQVTDDGFADPDCAFFYRRGVRVAREAADAYTVLRSLADEDE